VKFLEVRSAYLDNDEQGVFNDVDEVQLGVSSVLGYVHIVPRPCADLDGLHHSAHTGHHVGPLSLGELPGDST